MKKAGFLNLSAGAALILLVFASCGGALDLPGGLPPGNIKEPVYTVSYRAGDAAGKLPEPQEARKNEKIRISKGESLSFSGGKPVTSWNTSPDGSGRVYTVGQYTEIREDTVLYAQDSLPLPASDDVAAALAEALELLPANTPAAADLYKITLPRLGSPADTGAVFDAIPAGRYVSLDFSDSGLELMGDASTTRTNDTIVEVTLPTTTKTINGYLFQNFTELKTVTIPAEAPIETIWGYIFAYSSATDLYLHIPFDVFSEAYVASGVFAYTSGLRIHVPAADAASYQAYLSAYPWYFLAFNVIGDL
jgi:hypothetical protein